MCGDDIVQACTRWLNEGIIPSSLGDTNIVLVPKCDAPNSMSDLRPESLCNVVYKILPKPLGVTSLLFWSAWALPIDGLVGLKCASQL